MKYAIGIGGVVGTLIGYLAGRNYLNRPKKTIEQIQRENAEEMFEYLATMYDERMNDG